MSKDGQRRWREANRDHIVLWRQLHYQANAESLRAKRKNNYSKEDPVARRAKRREQYRGALGKKIRDYQMRRYRDPKSGVREKMNAYQRRRRQSDPQYRMAMNIRSRINNALRDSGVRKNTPLEKLIGCSVEFLKGYLESQFKEGMAWGKIHVDHVRPLAAFDLTDAEEQRRAFHYSNMAPMWPKDNLTKSARRTGEMRQPQLI